MPRMLFAGIIQTVGYDRDQETLQFALSTDVSRFSP